MIKRVWVGVVLPILIASGFMLYQSIIKTEYTEQPYSGVDLIIAITGNKPQIKEENVTFEKVDLTDMKTPSFYTTYDTVFISKDDLLEADSEEYVTVFRSSSVPVFFIDSEKSYIPFINEDLSYDTVPDLFDPPYISGILFFDGDNYYAWEYSMLPDKTRQNSINSIYSKIFKVVSKLKNGEKL